MSDLEELKLARVIDACGGIDGRVKMQKIVYLLKVMGYDLPYDDFRIRQQGPFSRAVACDTDTLRGAEILNEDPDELGNTREGEPIVRYSYSVRDEVVSFIRKRFDVEAPQGRPPLEDICQDLIGNDRAVLEVAATKVFLKREAVFQGKALDIELKRLKGHLHSSFKKAETLLKDWELS